MTRARQVANFDPALFAADEVSGDKVSGGTIGAGTIGGSTVVNTSGSITTTGAFRSIGIDDNADALAITIDANENVGIGVTPRTDWVSTRTGLQIGPRSVLWGESGNSNTLLSHNVYETSSGYAGIADGACAFFLMSGGEMFFRQGTNSAGAGGTVSMTNRIVVNSSGNVGIGATSPGARLQVSASNLNGYAAIFTNGNNATGYWGIKVLAGTDNNTSSKFFTAYHGSGGITGYLQTNGSGTFQLADVSDVRLKKEIADSTVDGYSIINQLTLREFKWKLSDIKINLGLVANEVLSIYPEAVEGKVDAVNEDGSINPLTVSTSEFIPVLLKGFQQMTEKVEALETKVTTLETANTSLEARVEALESA